LLPVADPEGVTSGGVQPPGSRGDDVVHTRTHSQDSGDESDATTTFTEEDDVDEMHALDDMEDEEERLIMNGGVGIPIGPVSISPFLPPWRLIDQPVGWRTTPLVTSSGTSACRP
jgi:RNA polymerase II subunit A small phosphatase-like protein